MPEPTYYITTTDDETTVYHCCYCERAGAEHHSSNEALFLSHMEQRHDGQMIEGPTPEPAATRQAPEDHPHGGPPGQTGEHPAHPHGGPPGQDKPEEPVPPVDPNASYAEQHEEPKP